MGTGRVAIDSDGDGFLDSIGNQFRSSPIDATSVPSTDFSETVDNQIGEASGFDSIEGNLKLWLDASNIDFANNTTLSDGDSIDTWLDLSGNNFSPSQQTDSKMPILTKNALNSQDGLTFDQTSEQYLEVNYNAANKPANVTVLSQQNQPVKVILGIRIDIKVCWFYNRV